MGCGALWLASGVVLTMRLVPTGHLLFFASPKKSKQKKGDPDVQVRCANFPHSVSFFRRVRTSRAARAVGQRTLVSEKRMLRSAGRRGVGSSIKRL